jgi:hypothetical protein
MSLLPQLCASRSPDVKAAWATDAKKKMTAKSTARFILATLLLPSPRQHPSLRQDARTRPTS